MSGLAYHWMEGDAHKIGRLALVDGLPFQTDCGCMLMQELHTNRLTFVDQIRLTEYLGDKTPAEQGVRT